MLIAAGERIHAAAQKTRLLEDIALREERLSKLAIRMLMVEENERRRISRELHDDAGQSLVVIRLQMEMIEQSMPPGSEAGAARRGTRHYGNNDSRHAAADQRPESRRTRTAWTCGGFAATGKSIPRAYPSDVRLT